jgi:hypothetical protein
MLLVLVLMLVLVLSFQLNPLLVVVLLSFQE